MHQNALLNTTNTIFIFYIFSYILYLNPMVLSSSSPIRIKIIKKTFYFLFDEIDCYIYFNTFQLIVLFYWTDFFYNILSCSLPFLVCLLETCYSIYFYYILLAFVCLRKWYSSVDFLNTLFYFFLLQIVFCIALSPIFEAFLCYL